MICYFYHLKDCQNFEEVRPIEIYIKYFEYLSDVLEKFNTFQKMKITKLYNQYGQEIPLTYRIQKTGLTVFFNDE